MKKVQIIVHQNYVEETVKSLHETGLVEIVDISKEQQDAQEDFNIKSINQKADFCKDYEHRLSKVIAILKKGLTKKKGIKAFLHPAEQELKVVEDKALDQLCSYAKSFLDEIEKDVLDEEKKLIEFNEKISKINSNIQNLNYVKDFDFDVNDLGESKYLFVKAGKTTDIQTIKSQLDDAEDTILYSQQFGSGKKIEWAVLIAALVSEKEKIEKICREDIAEFSFEGLSGSPKDLLKSLEKEKDELEKEKKLILKILKNLSDHYLNDLLALREEIQLEKVRIQVSDNFAKTNSTFVIKGWALEKNQEVLSKSLNKAANDNIECFFETPSPNPDDPPTHYETPEWAISFKTILEMFGTPRYNEVNPMFFVGIFFILFFGFMLGDAGYGLIILFASIFGYFKIGKTSPFIKGWSFLGIWLGVTTTVVGVLTNGFFGNLIPKFFYNDPNAPLYSLDLMGVHLPIDGIREPITMLSFALILALIQLNVGIALGMCQVYKNKQYKTLVLQYGSWIPLELGGGLLIGYMILDWPIDTIFVNIGIVLTLLGILLLFIHTRGPVGFFSITGFVGDWLSYSRLIALGLSTAGMALAINVVGELVMGLPIIGIVVFVVVIVFAHIANLGIQALGAAVHSLRLQYIEFFNRFYEGGGREFAPFKIKRAYTKIKEKKYELDLEEKI